MLMKKQMHEELDNLTRNMDEEKMELVLRFARAQISTTGEAEQQTKPTKEPVEIIERLKSNIYDAHRSVEYIGGALDDAIAMLGVVSDELYDDIKYDKILEHYAAPLRACEILFRHLQEGAEKAANEVWDCYLLAKA